MDNLFKALLIIILGAFLYLYFTNSENNRYQSMSHTEAIIVLDTRTGKVYVFGGEATYIHDLPNSISKKLELEKDYQY